MQLQRNNPWKPGIVHLDIIVRLCHWLCVLGTNARPIARAMANDGSVLAYLHWVTYHLRAR